MISAARKAARAPKAGLYLLDNSSSFPAFLSD